MPWLANQAAAPPEPGAGGALLVGQDLGVAEPGVVVDRGVHVVVAQASHPSGSFGASVDPPAAAVGDLAELLDVDVHQISGRLAFVAQPGGA